MTKQHRQAGPVTRFMRSMREQGFRRTFQSALNICEDWLFDWRYGTDTVSRIYQADLEFDHPNKKSAHPYIPNRGRSFNKLMAAIALPRGGIFVDYGSGKGKILMLASRFGFRRVVGLEFSEELHRVALSNVKKYQARTGCQSIEPVLGDASRYVLRDDENVLFFFNPFEQDVLDGCLGQIESSLARNPRHIWVIYFDPRFSRRFIDRLGLNITTEFVHGGYEVLVMESSHGASA